jgi:hypothetical protein
MKLASLCLRMFPAAAASLLAACGGGGGDGGSPAPPTAPATPSSGTYAWLLKAEGQTDNLKFALSLIHPLDSTTEVPIEPASAAVTDAKLVASATIDTATLQSGTLEPYALVYIVGGDVRRVPLRANGSAPAGRVQRAMTSSACRFVLEAVDHVTPEQSRFVVSSAGADGLCDTSDDGRAEVQLSADAGLVYTPLSGATPLAAVRSPATLAPRGWLLPTAVQLWAAGAAPISYRDANAPVQRVVQATHRSALVESASGLSMLDFAADGSVAETSLPAVSTTGWQAIGFDDQNYYAFRNGGSTASPSWAVQRISRSTPLTTQLGSGSGQITLSGMGSEVLYATVLSSTTVQTLRLPKAVPNAASVLATGPLASSFSTVLAGSAGVHLLWRISGLDTATPAYVVEMVNETGTVLYSAGAGGFSMGLADAARMDFSRSESRNRFLFVEGYGTRFFGDATLVAYDSVARSATRVGQLPGNAEFGADYVFANTVAGPTSPAAGFAARSINGVVQASGTRVFTFDPAAANSIRYTSRQP